MISAVQAFITEENKQANEPIFCYTIHNYDGASHDKNYTEFDDDVVYNGVTYEAAPIEHDELPENIQGQIDGLQLRMSNVSRAIQAYLELYDFRGKKVTITLVWANKLNDITAHIDFVYYIDNYEADESVAVFTLTTKFDLLEVSLPRRKFCTNFCSWVFGSAECGYGGAQPTCDHTMNTCDVTMNNLSRYGGFPSIPSQRIFT